MYRIFLVIRCSPPSEISSNTNRKMSSGNESPFHSAVDAVFQNWTALQMAVSQGAAGAQSADIAKWMVGATVQWFSENKDLETYEVEDFLIDIVNQEFNVLVDDGSVIEISKLICDFHRLSTSRDCEAELKRRLEALPKCDLSKCQVDQGEAPDVDESDNLEGSNEDANESMDTTDEPEPEVQDPDGWTVVKTSKKKK